MTRKDYVATAKIINAYFDLADQHDGLVANVHDYLIHPFIKLFEADNPNFNADIFWEACTKQATKEFKFTPEEQLLHDIFTKQD